MAKFSAVITLPMASKRLVKPERRGRSATRISSSKSNTMVMIDAADMASLKATMNSVLRDLTVVEAVSKVSPKGAIDRS